MLAATSPDDQAEIHIGPLANQHNHSILRGAFIASGTLATTLKNGCSFCSCAVVCASARRKWWYVRIISPTPWVQSKSYAITATIRCASIAPSRPFPRHFAARTLHRARALDCRRGLRNLAHDVPLSPGAPCLAAYLGVVRTNGVVGVGYSAATFSSCSC